MAYWKSFGEMVGWSYYHDLKEGEIVNTNWSNGGRQNNHTIKQFVRDPPIGFSFYGEVLFQKWNINNLKLTKSWEIGYIEPELMKGRLKKLFCCYLL